MSNLVDNIDKIHTTILGIKRIKQNLTIKTDDVVDWCTESIEQAKEIVKKGKNFYVYTDNAVITINAHSYTIITAHKKNK